MRTRNRAAGAGGAGLAPLALLALLALLAAAGVAGCGLNVRSADLFALTRTGQGHTLTIVVNDGGTLRCNGGAARQISSSMLIAARDLADNLGPDAGRHLTIPAAPGTASTFTIRLPQGTVRFPDQAGAAHRELAQAELFAVQAAAQCHPG